jgi:uncharacterized protein YbaR (Trm112 family)
MTGWGVAIGLEVLPGSPDKGSSYSRGFAVMTFSPPDRPANAVDPKPADHKLVDPKLLEILVCPLTKGPLEYDATKQELISRSAKLAYPIRDGIPIMLPEEARSLD